MILKFFKTAAVITVYVCASTTSAPPTAESLQDDGRDRVIADYEVINSEDTAGLPSIAQGKETPNSGRLGFASWFRSASRSEPEALPTPTGTGEEEKDDADIIDAEIIDSQTTNLTENGTSGNATDQAVAATTSPEEIGIIINNWLVAVVMMFVAGIFGVYMKE